MENSGMLSLIKISDKESDMLLDYLRNVYNTNAYDFIQYLIGKDYIKFMDILAGSSLKLPNRKSLYRDMEYIKIYCFVREHGFTADSVRCAAKIYYKNISFVKRALVKISKATKNEEEIEKVKYLETLKVVDGNCNSNKDVCDGFEEVIENYNNSEDEEDD